MSAATFKEAGNKALQAGNFDEAISQYTLAIEVDPSDHVFYSNRSAAYLSKGDADNALVDGEKCIELKPTWAKGYSRKGAALHAKKQYEEALRVYNEGLIQVPDDAALKSAVTEVTKLIESRNAAPSSGGLFGPQLLAKLVGHPKFGPKLADPSFMKKLQMLNSNPQLIMQDPEMMEVLQILIGGEGVGDEDDISSPSEDKFNPPTTENTNKKSAIPVPEPEPEGLTEEERESRKRKVEALAIKEKGNTLYKQKQFAEAIAAYDEAYQIDPSNIMLLNNKAAVLIEQGACEEAIALCKEAIEKGNQYRISFEDKAKIYARIASAYTKLDDIPSAIQAYGQAQMENFDKAIERKVKNLELEYKKSLKAKYVNPELGLEAKEKGNAAFRDGKFPEAITHYEEAVKRDPTNAAYYNNLAAALLKMGLFNDAKREVEKSLDLDRKYVKAWAKKGD